MFTYALAS